jgi:Na+/melibiose symporter-like transporter
VPFTLIGSLWAYVILRELAKPDSTRGYDIPGVTVFVLGLTGLVYGLSRAGLTGWTDALTLGGIAVGVVLLPIFVLIERHHKAPMLDLTIFHNRMFSAATAAAFINGLSRFALLFLFVFYFQGVKGQDPITAGIELAPMAIGMLIASPLAGMWADRRGSRALAAWGMVVTAAALVGMTTLGVHTGYFWPALWLFIVGVGSGMFNSPNTAAMMGTVPTYRRGIAAGARTMLQNTGAVISIAFVLAIVTSSVDKTTLFKIFSGVTSGLSEKTLDPFVSNMHTALWVLAITSIVGAGVSLLRPKGS